MELRFTKKQEQWRLRAQRFAETEIAPAVSRMELADEFPAEIVRRLAELGLMGIPIPECWGGVGADFISYVAVIEELSKASATVGVILSVHTSVGTMPLIHFGNEVQKARYAANLASGRWLGAFALTEPHAGSDAAAIRTTAHKHQDHYVLNGTKVFITNGGAADTYLTFAVTHPDRGARGITAFLVEKGTPGLHVGPLEKKMGLHGSNTRQLIYEDMHLPAAQRIGEEGQGFAIAMGSLDGGRIGIAAQALGIARAALETAFRVLGRNAPARTGRTARPAHKDLGVLASESDRLAQLAARTEAARLLVYRAAWLRQEGQPCTKEASMAKLFASDTAVAVASEAISLLGPEGAGEELPLERLFRDAKVMQIYEGTNEIHRVVIGNARLKE